jgi:DNA polymerase-3 subunit epsilon
MPKLCTCASMRRLYPGRKSYSLDKLCRDFGISLTNHHRALCDAEAAAELLLLVNEKRSESLARD